MTEFTGFTYAGPGGGASVHPKADAMSQRVAANAGKTKESLYRRGVNKIKANPKKSIAAGIGVAGISATAGYYAHRKRKQRRAAEAELQMQ